MTIFFIFNHDIRVKHSANIFGTEVTNDNSSMVWAIFRPAMFTLKCFTDFSFNFYFSRKMTSCAWSNGNGVFLVAWFFMRSFSYLTTFNDLLLSTVTVRRKTNSLSLNSFRQFCCFNPEILMCTLMGRVIKILMHNE